MEHSTSGQTSRDVFAQLSAYLARGWALVPLHDVSTGTCSCRDGAACRSAGKHPIAPAWQRPEHLVRDEGGLLAALARWPSCNWGLATGLISGCWALDYDPKSVAPNQAAEVAAVLQACWAAATWVQRTGSGGLHFVFALPADFVPNNGSGRLPRGFDVRGARRGETGGGQIVLAPSVSGVGAYEVLRDAAVHLAPAVVEGAVRPAAPRVPAPAQSFSAANSDMAGSYVAAAINGELAALRACWNQRNQRAWRAAARCVEMINTGLAGGEAVYAAWWAAAAAHPDPAVTVPDAELLRVWASAERHVGDRPADLSGVGGPSSWGGEAILPTGAPSVPLLGGGPGGATGVVTGGYPQAAHTPVDNSLDQRHSGAQSQVTGVTPVTDPVEAMLAQLLDVDQLRALPPPQPLINGVLDRNTTAWLIGASGSYKSFVALDMAARVGLGQPWREHDVVQGEVIYVVAEGAAGMRLRVDAWEREHGPMKGVRFLPMPVQANGPAWPVLVEVCRRVAPVLVIIDTQARVTIGLDENSNSDMSTYAERVDEIKRATGACVLTVHHLGRSGTNARGASAIDGAQDAELRVEKVGEYAIKLHMDKQKDQAEQPPMPIRLRRSDGGRDPVTGRDLSSLVLDEAGVPLLGGDPAEGEADISRRRALHMYRVVERATAHGGEGITRDAIKTLFGTVPEIAELASGARRMAAHRAWSFLVSRGRVMRYAGSQRFGVFPPPDGAPDGLLTMNTGGPDETPPDGWEIHWPPSDRAAAESGNGE
jgi:hypothetical protein